jgi:hypothetical protein
LSPRRSQNKKNVYEFVQYYGNNCFMKKFVQCMRIFDDCCGEWLDDDFAAKPPKPPSIAHLDKLFKNPTLPDLQRYASHYSKARAGSFKYVETNNTLDVIVNMNTNAHYVLTNDVMIAYLSKQHSTKTVTARIKQMRGNDDYFLVINEKGYFAVLMNRNVAHNSEESVECLKTFGCNADYVVNAHVHGFAIQCGGPHDIEYYSDKTDYSTLINCATFDAILEKLDKYAANARNEWEVV